MKLTINGQSYDVDMGPLRARATTGMEAMVADKGDKNPILRQLVKSACTFAMGVLGIKKVDRNDDPIKLVMAHVAELIFDGIEKEGLVVEGKLIEAPKAPAIEEAKDKAEEKGPATEKPKEE